MHRVVDLLASQFYACAFLKGFHRLLKLRGLFQEFPGTVSQSLVVVGTSRFAAYTEPGHQASESGGSAGFASFGFRISFEQEDVLQRATAPASVFENWHRFLFS